MGKDKFENIQRFWVVNGLIHRKWTDVEYKNCNPQLPKTEKLPYVICRNCGQIIGLYTDATFRFCDKCKVYNTKVYKINNIDTKLKCLELGEKELNGIIAQYIHCY